MACRIVPIKGEMKRSKLFDQLHTLVLDPEKAHNAIRQDAFLQFFGDYINTNQHSILVDNQGEPIVMYGDGKYFSKDPNYGKPHFVNLRANNGRIVNGIVALDNSRDAMPINETIEEKDLLEGYGFLDGNADAKTVLSKIKSGPYADLAKQLLKSIDKNNVLITHSPYRGSGLMRYTDDNIIQINSNNTTNPSDFEHQILHEIVHALTVATKNKSFWNQMEQARKVYNSKGDKKQYGFKDKYEFVAELMTNREFARELSNSESLWDKVINAIKRLLGLTGNSVDQLKSTISDFIANDFEFDASVSFKPVNFENTGDGFVDDDGKSYRDINNEIKKKEKYSPTKFEADAPLMSKIEASYNNPQFELEQLITHDDLGAEVDVIVTDGNTKHYYLMREIDTDFANYNVEHDGHIAKDMHTLEAGIVEAMAYMNGENAKVFVYVKDKNGGIYLVRPSGFTSKVDSYIVTPEGFTNNKMTKAAQVMKEVQANIEKRIRNIMKKRSGDPENDIILEKDAISLKNLQKLLNENHVGKALSLFMSDAGDRLATAFDEVSSDAATITQLADNFELANAFDFLNDIQEELALVGIDDAFGSVLQDLINRKDNIKTIYQQKMRSIHAAKLAKAAQESGIEGKFDQEIARLEKQLEALDGKTSAINNMRRRQIKAKLTRLRDLNKAKDAEFFAQQLKASSSDHFALDYWLNPMISAGNSILSTFAKTVKNNLQAARLRTYDRARRLAQFTPKAKNNPAETNKGHYEEVNVINGEFVDGKYTMTTSKAMYLVSPYDFEAYYKSRGEMYTRFNELMDAGREKEAIKTRRDWYKQNTKPVEDLDNIIAAQDKLLSEGVITREEYNNFFISNVTASKKLYWQHENGKITDDKYANALRDALITYPDKNATGILREAKYPPSTKKVPNEEYHKELLDMYMEAQAMLPKYARPGYRLPSVRKNFGDRVLDGQAKEAMNEKWKEITDVIDDNEALLRYGTEDTIPVYYNQFMDAKDVSLDLASSVVRFHEAATKHKALSNMHAEANGLLNVMNNRQMLENKYDRMAKKAGLDKLLPSTNKDYAAAHLQAFVDTIFYGKTREKTVVNGINVDKLIDSFTSFASTTQIGGFKPLLHINNLMHGKIMTRIEANSKEFFNHKDLSWANKEYTKNLTELSKDFFKPVPDSKMGQLIAHLDPMQGNFSDHMGRNFNMSGTRKALGEAWYFGMSAGERAIAIPTMLAVLKHEQHNGKSVYEQIELDNNGKIKFPEGLDMDALRNRIHAISKRNQGVYNSFDAPTIQRHWYGQLLMMYRKFVVPGIKKRYKRVGYDEELGAVTEGMYNTMFSALFTDFKGMLKIVSPFSQNPENYSEREIANIRRAAMETAFLLTTMMLAKIMAELEWDDEEFTAYPMYIAMRLTRELGFYINPESFMEILDSPTVGYGLLNKVFKFAKQMGSPMEQFERDTGMWESGDSKLLARFLQLFGISGYTTNPDYAIEILEKIGA